MLEEAGCDGVVCAGVGFCAKQDDSFVVAVDKAASGDGVMGAPECDADGGVVDCAVLNGGVGCGDFDGGGVEPFALVGDGEVADFDVWCFYVDGVAVCL